MLIKKNWTLIYIDPQVSCIETPRILPKYRIPDTSISEPKCSHYMTQYT